jgi:hypothetical protein
LGLSREYAEGFTAYKRSILGDFETLIQALDRAFPDFTIIVRPHPAENQEVYHRVASTCEHVRVINEGNVVPWLLASKVLVHNGCTTGIEAFALDVPAVAYRARKHEQYDRDFHQLPNRLSHECFNLDEVKVTLEKILSGQLGIDVGDERKALMNKHLAAQDGPLACERIVDVLEEIMGEMSAMPKPAVSDRLISWVWAKRRRISKRLRGYRTNMSHNRPDFLRHRYPELSFDDMQTRMLRFQQLLGYNGALTLEPIAGQFFRISS